VTSWYIELRPNNETAVKSDRSLDCKPDCERLVPRQINTLKNSTLRYICVHMSQSLIRLSYIFFLSLAREMHNVQCRVPSRWI
jgi:hypothetical protein